MAISPQLLLSEFDPYLLARTDTVWQGTLELSAMPRLQASCTRAEGHADVAMRFIQDEAGQVVVQGKVDASVEMTCQRCMQQFREQLGSEFCLSPVVNDEQAKQLPSQYEPLLMEQKTICTTEIIEDELLLALPLIAMHADEQCPQGDRFKPIEATEALNKPNPFDVLKVIGES